MMTLDEFAPLSLAEEKVLSDCALPARTVLGDGEPPAKATPETTVRAEFLRFILLGGANLHDKGLRLRGGWIQGMLDLQGCDIRRDVTLTCCHLTEGVTLINADLRGFHLSGSSLGGLTADNATFSGSLYLRSGTEIGGEVSLAGARIAGDLQICDAVLRPGGQDAVFAPSLKVEGSVYLGNYPYSEGLSTLVAEGTLFFSSARIAHDCFVSNTSISLQSDVMDTGVFAPTEEHGSNIALSLARAQIGGILFFQDNQIGSGGVVNLAGAEVARLKDEPAGPGANYPIRLDGFRYKDFSRRADVSLKARLDWLERRPDDLPFVAQPYEQLAEVLTRLGHRDDARTVLLRKERLLRAEDREQLREEQGVSPRYMAAAVSDAVLYWTVAYGYRPGRSILFAVLLILGLGLFFRATWYAGDMTPNAAPILTSSAWIAATELHPEGPALVWSRPGEAGQDYESFSPFAYAADLVIPLVAFGQEDAWAPSTSRSPLGRIGWWLRWFAKGAGWILTALAAAAVTGVIRRE
ncbi:hypothetical protein AADZ90_003660 [Aestuariibius sp. 2305UL40-4]|uniref:hypothetical protein n=1 Tax=Aestuariibius violaceus TaxID=3234132 RepID=UPI00345E2D7E